MKLSFQNIGKVAKADVEIDAIKEEPQLNMKLNFLKEVYQTNILDMTPDNYQALINTKNVRGVISPCTQ